MVKKTLKICANVYTEYRRMTDGRTDGRTDGQTDILPPHMFLCDILLPSGVTNDESPRYAYASRGKNVINFTTVVALDAIYPAVS